MTNDSSGRVYVFVATLIKLKAMEYLRAVSEIQRTTNIKIYHALRDINCLQKYIYTRRIVQQFGSSIRFSRSGQRSRNTKPAELVHRSAVQGEVKGKDAFFPYATG